MQPIEQFMRDYFRERTEVIRTEIARREPFRQRFYTNDCVFDSRRGAIEHSETEKILDITSSEAGAQVTTTGLGAGNRRWRLRYHLQSIGDRWLIRAAELECGICRGTGKKKDGRNECPICKGKGWGDFGTDQTQP